MFATTAAAAVTTAASASATSAVADTATAAYLTVGAATAASVACLPADAPSCVDGVRADPFDEATLGALDRLARTRLDDVVLSWGNDMGERHDFTAAELDRWSAKVAGFLASRGVGVGDVVAVSLDGHYQAWLVALAALRLGATALRLPADAGEAEVYRLLDGSQACAVVCSNRGEAPEVLEHVVYLCPCVTLRAMVNGDGASAVFCAPDEPDETCLPPAFTEDGLPHGAELSGPDGVCALCCLRPGWLDFNTCARVAAPLASREAQGRARVRAAA
ncbi:MAG: AMP-binding protein [Coriobacteriales bacterium]